MINMTDEKKKAPVQPDDKGDTDSLPTKKRLYGI